MTRGEYATAAPGRRVPLDLLAVSVLLGIACASLFVPPLRETVLRQVFTLPVVVFLPGYAIIAAIFPRRRTARATGGRCPGGNHDAERWINREAIGSIDGLERCALALLCSVAITAFVGLGLTVAPVEFRYPWLFAGGALVTITGTVVALYRRRAVPPTERFAVDWHGQARAASWFVRPNSVRQTVLVLVMIGSVLAAVSAVGLSMTSPVGTAGDGDTELSLLTAGDDGYVADNYPEAVAPGSDVELTTAIENQEGKHAEYTLVAQQTRIEGDEVSERDELGRRDYGLANGESEYDDWTISPTATDGEIRITFLLYEAGEVPETPTKENAYRSVHIWIEVSDSSTADT